MNDLLDTNERAALDAVLHISHPLPQGWVPLTEEMAILFNPEIIAYGAVYMDGSTEVADIDWCIAMKWDGWIVTMDIENTDTGQTDDDEGAPFTAAPPEVLLHVMSEGARVILARKKEVA